MKQVVEIAVKLVMATPLLYQHTNYVVVPTTALVALGERREDCWTNESGVSRRIAMDIMKVEVICSLWKKILSETEGRDYTLHWPFFIVMYCLEWGGMSRRQV
ncbi:hypothetical protein AMECASPLE_017698 [Ameca splendens]|uniref:Uncharacterized protein n=1 Tax=Ameca splendens TaxID=208324 RepID=A0ABV0Y2C8_9TELE